MIYALSHMSQTMWRTGKVKRNMKFNLPRGGAVCSAAVLLAVAVGLAVRDGSVNAAGGVGDLAPGESEQVTNEECLTCHGSEGIEVRFPSGDRVDAYVDAQVFAESVHGKQGLTCVNCHPDKSEGYPHRPLTANSARVYTMQRYEASCAACHFSKYAAQLDSVHATALERGYPEAAICVDCHGAHDVQSPDQPRSLIPQTCRQCHSAIYDQYEESVHGEALLDESNPDVPTCIDCHGVHNIDDPTTIEFRLNSPELCAGCHTDPEIMDKYGLSTAVLETYVADFHGTTVTLFEQQTPDQETNKAVCFDCHGVHDIRHTDDPESHVVRENLAETCQQCHPDATESFPAAWTSHYIPSREKTPLVFFVNQFYAFLIPTVLGSMGLFVLSDVWRRIRSIIKRNGQREQNDD
jgi:predicted CXXCH cytochrome family protein